MTLIRQSIRWLLNNFVRRSRYLTRVIFGTKIICDSKVHWDFTTLVMKKALRETVRPNYKVLEIGTGPHAILSAYLARRTACDITACDINPDYVDWAIKTARANETPIGVIHSDLFENIAGRFDIIFWNSVYVPLMEGKKIRMDRANQYETDWCGGATGFESIERFLKEARDCLSESGRVLLGFCKVYLPESDVIARCVDAGYSVDRIVRQPLNPSIVIVLSA